MTSPTVLRITSAIVHLIIFLFTITSFLAVAVLDWALTLQNRALMSSLLPTMTLNAVCIALLVLAAPRITVVLVGVEVAWVSFAIFALSFDFVTFGLLTLGIALALKRLAPKEI